VESQLHRSGTPLPVVRAPRGAAFGGFAAGESAPRTGWNDEAQPVLNGLSVDVEEWWHEPGHPLDDSPELWSGLESIAERGTDTALEMFEKHRARATFFVLGWVARRYPALIRRIADAGHELGVHGQNHRLVDRLTPEQFRKELRESRAAVEDAAGVSARVHRAPYFSISSAGHWAFEVLVEEGFVLDASVFASKRLHGGVPGSDGRLYRIPTAAGEIDEVPTPVEKLGPVDWPVGGGGYLRLLPAAVQAHLIAKRNARGLPAIIYSHPREFAPQHPRLKLGAKRRFQSYHGVNGFNAKLEKILSRFSFGALSDLLPDSLALPHRPAALHAAGA
jgi:polysaccharide deacetylase family protein (PEP-CTERM system associated)